METKKYPVAQVLDLSGAKYVITISQENQKVELNMRWGREDLTPAEIQGLCSMTTKLDHYVKEWIRTGKQPEKVYIKTEGG